MAPPVCVAFPHRAVLRHVLRTTDHPPAKITCTRAPHIPAVRGRSTADPREFCSAYHGASPPTGRRAVGCAGPPSAGRGRMREDSAAGRPGKQGKRGDGVPPESVPRDAQAPESTSGTPSTSPWLSRRLLSPPPRGALYPLAAINRRGRLLCSPWLPPTASHVCVVCAALHAEPSGSDSERGVRSSAAARICRVRCGYGAGCCRAAGVLRGA